MPSSYDFDALRAIAARRAHFVLCDADKRAVRAGWNKRGASLAEIKRHRGLVGIVPASIGVSALDVDAGDFRAIARRFRPFVRMRSRRRDGRHLYYGDHRARPNGRFCAAGCRGDIRGGRGYLIIWPGQEGRLATALRKRDPLDFPFPDVLVGPVPRRVLHAPATRDRASLSYVLPGRRNCALFDALRLWAYRQMRGLNMSVWMAFVSDHARQLNMSMPLPLPSAEAERVAVSVAEWTWRMLPATDAAGWPVGQADGALSRGRRCATANWRG